MWRVCGIWDCLEVCVCIACLWRMSREVEVLAVGNVRAQCIRYS